MPTQRASQVDDSISSGADNSAATQQAIAEAAYRRSEQRGFEPGRELEDWLAAEREVAERGGAGVVG